MPGEAALADHVGMLPLAWKAHNPVASPPQLVPGTIHLWSVDLAQSDAALTRYLTPSDRDRGARIVDAGKRRLYLGGRAGMRLLLSAYTGIDYDAIRFGYGSRGKPVLANDEGTVMPEFNYTLSRDKVLYALSLDQALGVDMEALPRTASAGQLAARMLTASERAAWERIPLHLRNDAMLCCWTRKEAYGKAIGVGIRYNLGQVALFQEPGNSGFRTPVQGLFRNTETDGMPRHLEGVQLELPFPAVAALMYPADASDRVKPAISAHRLIVE